MSAAQKISATAEIVNTARENLKPQYYIIYPLETRGFYFKVKVLQFKDSKKLPIAFLKENKYNKNIFYNGANL